MVSIAPQSASSPICRLPPETIGDIFWEVGAGDALVLSHVCQFWRAVATSMPMLWSFIELEVSSRSLKSRAGLCNLLLQRSKSCPITLSMTEIAHGHTANSPAVAAILSQVSRWQTVTLDIGPILLVQLQAAKVQLPLLQSLRISSTLCSTWPALGWVLHSLLSAPNLHFLSLEVEHTLWGLQLPSSLTDCRIHKNARCSVEECFRILRACPNLVTYIVSTHFTSLSLPETPMHHTSLRKLGMHQFLDSWRFLRSLTLPALEDYEYTSVADTFFSLGHFNDLLLRSNPPLRRLIIDQQQANSINDEHLVQCLELCPLLEELQVTSASAYAWNSTIMGLITHRKASNTCCLLPKLHTLKLTAQRRFNFQSLADMLESRWWQHDVPCSAPSHTKLARMRRVEFDRHPSAWGELKPLIARAFKTLCALRDDGLEIIAMDQYSGIVTLEDYLADHV